MENPTPIGTNWHSTIQLPYLDIYSYVSRHGQGALMNIHSFQLETSEIQGLHSYKSPICEK